jgi:hypothetical protein
MWAKKKTVSINGKPESKKIDTVDWQKRNAIIVGLRY